VLSKLTQNLCELPSQVQLTDTPDSRPKVCRSLLLNLHKLNKRGTVLGTTINDTYSVFP